MTQNIKEKVLKEILGDIEKKADEHQLKGCGDPTECHVNLWCYDLSPNIEKAIDPTLAETEKEIERLKGNLIRLTKRESKWKEEVSKVIDEITYGCDVVLGYIVTPRKNVKC